MPACFSSPAKPSIRRRTAILEALYALKPPSRNRIRLRSNRWLLGAGRRLRKDEAIGGVADFTPGQLRQGAAGEQRPLHGRESYPDANGGPPLGQVPRDQELIVPEASVGGLHDVLRG